MSEIFYCFVQYARKQSLLCRTMNKTEFVSAIFERTKLKKNQAKEAIDAALEIIQEQVAAGESVDFVGFGSFCSVELKEREGINPKTKEKISIPAKVTPKFKPGKAFKELVSKK